MYSIKDISEYIVALIAAFGHHFSISDTEAYAYTVIRRYGTEYGYLLPTERR